MSTVSNNSLEMLIAQARSAGQAGVFETTQVDVSSLVAPLSLVRRPADSRLIRFYERALVGLPLAACVGIVFGIASMMGNPSFGPSGQPGSVLPDGSLAVNTHGLNDSILSVGTTELCSLESVTRCFAGPGEAVASDCGCADLDSDGDVDLADLGAYQQRFTLVN